MSLVHITAAALILSRITGLIVAMPGLSMRTMPTMVRVIMILCITSILVPTVPVQEYDPDLIVLALDTFIEFLLGFVMGWMVNLIFAGMSMGTELISTQIGQAAAKQFNPSMATSQGPLGTISVLLAITIFLDANIHLKMLWLLADSFKQIPPGQIHNIVGGLAVWVEFSSVLIDISIRIAGPIIAFVFLNNFFLAMLCRLAPNMNVFFSVGFLVSMIGGMILFTMLMPSMFSLILDYCDEALKRVPVMIDAIKGG